MILVYIIIAVIAIAVNVWISNQFMEVSEIKGHTEMKYFWICFFFGITGYLLVIALPDIRKFSGLTQGSVDVRKSRVSGNEKMCAYCGQRQPASNTICMNCGERI